MGKKATNRSKQRNVEEEKIKFNFDVKKISQSTKMGAVDCDVYTTDNLRFGF